MRTRQNKCSERHIPGCNYERTQNLKSSNKSTRSTPSSERCSFDELLHSPIDGVQTFGRVRSRSADRHGVCWECGSQDAVPASGVPRVLGPGGDDPYFPAKALTHRPLRIILKSSQSVSSYLLIRTTIRCKVYGKRDDDCQD